MEDKDDSTYQILVPWEEMYSEVQENFPDLEKIKSTDF